MTYRQTLGNTDSFAPASTAELWNSGMQKLAAANSFGFIIRCAGDVLLSFNGLISCPVRSNASIVRRGLESASNDFNVDTTIRLQTRDQFWSSLLTRTLIGLGHRI